MNQGLVAVIFLVGMLAFMGLGVPLAFALVLTGASMAWVLGFWDTQLFAQNLVAGAHDTADGLWPGSGSTTGSQGRSPSWTTGISRSWPSRWGSPSTPAAGS